MSSIANAENFHLSLFPEYPVSIFVGPSRPIALSNTLVGNSDLVSPSEKAIKTFLTSGSNPVYFSQLGIGTTTPTQKLEISYSILLSYRGLTFLNLIY